MQHISAAVQQGNAVCGHGTVHGRILETLGKRHSVGLSAAARQHQLNNSFIFPFMLYYYAHTYSFVSCFVNSISDTETMMPGGDCTGRTQCFVFPTVL